MLKKEAAARAFIVILLAVLLGCCAGFAFVYTSSNRSASAKELPPKISIAWSIPAGQMRYVAFAPEGRYACTISSDSMITCYDTSVDSGSARIPTLTGGKQIHSPVRFAVKAPGIDRIVMAPNAEYSMIYSNLNPLSSELKFLDKHGRVHWKMDVIGAVWSADASEIQDGARFVIGTGERYIYVVDIDGRHKRFRRWRTPGAVTSVALNDRGSNVVYGTWQDSGLACANDSGDNLWEDKADSASLIFIEELNTPKRLLVKTMPNRAGIDGEFTFLDGEGEPIWQGILDASKKSKVFSSPEGRYACVGYDEVIRHKSKSGCEKHAVLFDSSGKKLWEKGSLFFSADPVLVTDTGYVVVVSRGNALIAISPTGEPEPSVTLPAPVRSAVASRDASHMIVSCANGKTYFLNITQ